MLKFLGISQSTTTGYHPQGNGTVERIHLFFRHAVSTYINQDMDDWDDCLEVMMHIYNDAYHESLGTTPAKVVLGRSLEVPYLKEYNKAQLPPLGFASRLAFHLYRIQ